VHCAIGGVFTANRFLGKKYRKYICQGITPAKAKVDHIKRNKKEK
jgi:hypothetical protein